MVRSVRPTFAESSPMRYSPTVVVTLARLPACQFTSTVNQRDDYTPSMTPHRGTRRTRCERHRVGEPLLEPDARADLSEDGVSIGKRVLDALKGEVAQR